MSLPREEQVAIWESEFEGFDPLDIESGIRSGDETFTKGRIEERQARAQEYPSQWTLEVTGPRKVAIRRLHEARSERAQSADERQNAPVTTDEEKWIENKNRYDYPGVDTIPETRQAARAEAAAGWALEHGYLDRAEHKGSGSRLQGKFSPSASKRYGKGEHVARVQKEANTPSMTLAHEVGHAIDHRFGIPEDDVFEDAMSYDESQRYKLSEFLFSSDDFYEGDFMDLEPDERREVASKSNELKREAERVSQQYRGGIGSRGKKYREDPKELTADFFASAVVQPRATRREAPNMMARLEEAAGREGFLDIFPEPLGRDPERRGILDV